MIFGTTLNTELARLATDERITTLRAHLSSGTKLYLVGGSVRDIVLERHPKDLDLACALSAVQISAQLANSTLRCIETGLKHNTVTVIPIPEQGQLEITSFRQLPEDLSPATIANDLTLRDFTINALAYDIAENVLIDPLNGLADLQLGIIRACRDPQRRFCEDALRILRMVRLSCSLGFTYDTRTFEAAQESLSSLASISTERIRDEISKILVSAAPARGFRDLHQLGALALLLPEVAAFVGYEQNHFHKSDLFEHTLEVIENTAPFLPLRLAALLHDVGKPVSLTIGQDGIRHFYRHEVHGAQLTKAIMTRLKYSTAEINTVAKLVRLHMRHIECGDGGLRRIIRDTGDEYHLWRALKAADALACLTPAAEINAKLATFDKRIEKIINDPISKEAQRLAISGRDLLALGFREGPQIGKILKMLHEHVLDCPIDNVREKLLALAKH